MEQGEAPNNLQTEGGAADGSSEKQDIEGKGRDEEQLLELRVNAVPAIARMFDIAEAGNVVRSSSTQAPGNDFDDILHNSHKHAGTTGVSFGGSSAGQQGVPAITSATIPELRRPGRPKGSKNVKGRLPEVKTVKVHEQSQKHHQAHPMMNSD